MKNSVFAASRKMARASSIKNFDVGVDREVFFGVHESGRYLTITRYYSDEEMEDKYEEARAKNPSKPVGFIPPYANIYLNQGEVAAIQKRQREIMTIIMKAQGGMMLDEDELLFRVLDEGDLFLTFDLKYMSMHVRRFWWSKQASAFRPNKRGVCLYVQEFASVMMYMENLAQELCAE